MVGRDGSASGTYGRGLYAEMSFIDGTAFTDANDFGETNEDTNQWVPIKYAGTYGDNGFFLKMEDKVRLFLLPN